MSVFDDLYSDINELYPMEQFSDEDRARIMQELRDRWKPNIDRVHEILELINNQQLKTSSGNTAAF